LYSGDPYTDYKMSDQVLKMGAKETLRNDHKQIKRLEKIIAK